MYEKVSPKSELALGSNNKKIFVDALDVVTSYQKNQQDIKLAVSVSNFDGWPIFESAVELLIDSPDGTKFSLKGETDPNGIAIFEINNARKGRWEVVVFSIDHPDYRYDSSGKHKPWSVTYI